MIRLLLRALPLAALIACSREPLPRSSGCGDTRIDPLNCGKCGNACPTPLNAFATCTEGACGRSPCAPGYFDPGGGAFGCSMHCDSAGCTGPGVPAGLVPPPPESGDVAHAMASGSSFGSAVQTTLRYTNIGILGDPTPAAAGDGGVGGQVKSANSRFINRGGFSSALMH